MSRQMMFLALSLLFFAHSAAAQSVEVQAYPAGLIGVVGYPLHSSSILEVRIHVGANVTDRRDFGEHDDENGSGFGGGVDLNWFRFESHQALWVGARLDVWRLGIDWEDDDPKRSGDSSITVVQPTARAGWRTRLGRARLDFTLGIGAEINVQTSGDNVGEGAILLAGLRLSR